MPMCKTGPSTSRQLPDEFAARLRMLKTACRRALKREKRTLARQTAERDEAARWPWYRQMADSLLAAPGSFPRGTRDSTVRNVHTGQEDRISLNAKLTVHENAQLLYKKARKGERGEKVAVARVMQTQQALADSEALLASLLDLDTPRDDAGSRLEDLEHQARQMGIVKTAAASGRKGAACTAVPYRHFTIDDYDVYVGKTETQNDELTSTFARPWDIWAHVSAHAGSHVVMRRQKNADWPARQTLAKVASLAAWFSKARHTSYAEVHVTEARFVRKPRKFPPGRVVAERGKTVRVAPRSPKELFGRKQPGPGSSADSGEESP
ncbi:MAG: DUF814 domain-containing protein [Chitinivibrionales bacterium]|nr:DUF814 domain-containing protein [Chitinivibrionales bacterium]MBD3397083.1 DUF814 domain-containing protein [Chitinivibrionales bacterium]